MSIPVNVQGVQFIITNKPPKPTFQSCRKSKRSNTFCKRSQIVVSFLLTEEHLELDDSLYNYIGSQIELFTSVKCHNLDVVPCQDTGLFSYLKSICDVFRVVQQLTICDVLALFNALS